MHKQTQKYDETKKIIDDSVRVLIDKIGLENLSVSAICKEAKISRTNFYYYYKSKEEVILSRFDYMDQHIENKVKPFLSYKDFQQDLTLFATEYFSLSESISFNYAKQIYISQLTLSGEEVTSPTRQIYQVAVAIFKAAQDNNQITDAFSPEALATKFLICIRGVTFDWCVQNASYNLTENGLSLIDIFVEGLKNKAHP